MNYYLKIVDNKIEIYRDDNLFILGEKKFEFGFFYTLVITTVAINHKEIVFSEKISLLHRKCEIIKNDTEYHLDLKKRKSLFYEGKELKGDNFGIFTDQYRIKLNDEKLLITKPTSLLKLKYSDKIIIQENNKIDHRILLTYVCFLLGDTTYS